MARSKKQKDTTHKRVAKIAPPKSNIGKPVKKKKPPRAYNLALRFDRVTQTINRLEPGSYVYINSDDVITRVAVHRDGAYYTYAPDPDLERTRPSTNYNKVNSGDGVRTVPTPREGEKLFRTTRFITSLSSITASRVRSSSRESTLSFDEDSQSGEETTPPIRPVREKRSHSQVSKDPKSDDKGPPRNLPRIQESDDNESNADPSQRNSEEIVRVANVAAQIYREYGNRMSRKRKRGEAEEKEEAESGEMKRYKESIEQLQGLIDEYQESSGTMSSENRQALEDEIIALTDEIPRRIAEIEGPLPPGSDNEQEENDSSAGGSSRRTVGPFSASWGLGIVKDVVLNARRELSGQITNTRTRTTGPRSWRSNRTGSIFQGLNARLLRMQTPSAPSTRTRSAPNDPDPPGGDSDDPSDDENGNDGPNGDGDNDDPDENGDNDGQNNESLVPYSNSEETEPTGGVMMNMIQEQGLGARLMNEVTPNSNETIGQLNTVNITQSDNREDPVISGVDPTGSADGTIPTAEVPLQPGTYAVVPSNASTAPRSGRPNSSSVRSTDQWWENGNQETPVIKEEAISTPGETRIVPRGARSTPRDTISTPGRAISTPEETRMVRTRTRSIPSGSADNDIKREETQDLDNVPTVEQQLQDIRTMILELANQTRGDASHSDRLAAGAPARNDVSAPNGQVNASIGQVFSPSTAEGTRAVDETLTSDAIPPAANPATMSDQHRMQTGAMPSLGMNSTSANEVEQNNATVTQQATGNGQPSSQTQDSREQEATEQAESSHAAMEDSIEQQNQANAETLAEQGDTQSEGLTTRFLNWFRSRGRQEPGDVLDMSSEDSPMDVEQQDQGTQTETGTANEKKYFVKPRFALRDFTSRVMQIIREKDSEDDLARSEDERELYAHAWNTFLSQRLNAGEYDMSRQSTRNITSPNGTIQLATSRAAANQPDNLHWSFIWDQIHRQSYHFVTPRFVAMLVQSFGTNPTEERLNWLLTGNSNGDIGEIEFTEDELTKENNLYGEITKQGVVAKLLQTIEFPSTPVPSPDYQMERQPQDNSRGPHRETEGESELDRPGFINNIPDPRVSERGGKNVPNVVINTTLNPKFDPNIPEGPTNRRLIHDIRSDKHAGAHPIMRDLLQAEADRLLKNKQYHMYSPIHSQPTDRFLGAKNYRRLSIPFEDYMKQFSHLAVDPNDIETMHKWNKKAMIQYGEYMYAFATMDKMEKVVPQYDPSDPDGVRQEFMELQELMKEIKAYQLVSESRAERVHDSMATNRPVEQHLEDFYRRTQEDQERKLLGANSIVIATDTMDDEGGGDDDDDDMFFTPMSSPAPSTDPPSAPDVQSQQSSPPPRREEVSSEGLRSSFHPEPHEIQYGIRNRHRASNSERDRTNTSFRALNTGRVSRPTETPGNAAQTSHFDTLRNLYNAFSTR